MQPIDQGAILRSGAALIPDLQQQIMQRQQMDLNRQALGLQQARFTAEQDEALREQAENAAYQRDMEMIGSLPVDQQPQAIAALSRRYPKQSEALKRSWDMQDTALKDANFRDTSNLYFMIKNGAPNKAAAIIRKRIEADRAAGQDTEDDEAIAQALESGDPAEVSRAMAAVTAQLQIAAGPDKFASISGVVDPQGTTLQQEYDWLISQGRFEDAENLVANKVDPVIPVTTQDGTTGYLASDFRGSSSPTRPIPRGATGQTGRGGDTGGGVSGGKGRPVADAKAVARGLFPNIAITDHRRDPNSALGKANPGSWHNRSGAAIDVKPIPGMSFGDYVKRYRDAGYTILEARNEVGKGRSGHATGNHWHIVLGGGPKGDGPVRVTSIAQARSLPSGTEFIDPRGVRRSVP